MYFRYDQQFATTHPPLPGGQGQCAGYAARQHGRERRRRAERGDDGVMYRGKAAADCGFTTLHFLFVLGF
jgi:hypothetical protein